MPLQNRVDPFGEIHAVPQRGLFTGNRGIIHDASSRTLTSRRWTSKAWIVCERSYGERRRVPMATRSWTELFFLDEVTALAAGHRPCFFCRRHAALSFLACFGSAAGLARPKARLLDEKLHGERLAAGGSPVCISGDDLDRLPDGTVIASDGVPFALCGGEALEWTFSGYGERVRLSRFAGKQAQIVTPATTVAVLAAGYEPAWHPTARR